MKRKNKVHELVCVSKKRAWRKIRKSWSRIATISVLITLPISLTVIAWRVSLSFPSVPLYRTQTPRLGFVLIIYLDEESKIRLSQMCSERKEGKIWKRFSLPDLWHLKKKERNKHREAFQVLLMCKHNGIFMLHFHCYFDVQILLSHSLHFLISERFLIGR